MSCVSTYKRNLRADKMHAKNWATSCTGCSKITSPKNQKRCNVTDASHRYRTRERKSHVLLQVNQVCDHTQSESTVQSLKQKLFSSAATAGKLSYVKTSRRIASPYRLCTGRTLAITAVTSVCKALSRSVGAATCKGQTGPPHTVAHTQPGSYRGFCL